MVMNNFLQNMIDKHCEMLAEQRSKEMFTLGDFIRELEKYPKSWDVYIKPFHLIPLSFTSYRGYYSDLCLTYATRYEWLGNEDVTVGSLLKEAQKVNGKTLTGYKGGNFLMTEQTPIWVSDDDFSTGMAIANIEEYFDGCVVINCYQRED